MIKYLHYILKTMFKKWSIRISLVVGIFISTIIIRTAMKFGGEFGATLTSINQMILIFPYMFITIFTVFATTHAFKDGEIDGSELLIISKPIRRNKIVLAKFVAVISAIIIYHAIFAIPLFWVASQAHVSDDGSKLLFVLSFVIGSSIIQLLMLGVITLLATILGKNRYFSNFYRNYNFLPDDIIFYW